ncbi:hypothetical protein ACEWY4_005418 [Coilia grayii]|uniref:IQ domain-containing protein C n=1 Tax=Coilia grayii TaxID=363190 RepID=A0ABD1KIH8_9TELE
MERNEWLQKVTGFQAFCRGYLVRTAIQCVQNEYEEIVKEIEGDLNDLQWKGGVFQIPAFSEEDILFWGAGRHDRVQSTTQPERDVTEEKKPSHIEEVVPERDTVPSANTAGNSSCLSDGRREGESGQRWAKEQVHTQSIQDTTTALSQLGVDPSLLRKGSLRQSLETEPPRTREEARMFRNKLAMELLWIQQAIGSRKKYLTLRKNLEDGQRQSSTAAST